jgi:DNA polymerase-3 subunit beta
MKLTFQQKDLQAATQVIQNIVNPTTSLNILRNVLVESGDNAATFLASDMEAYARVTVSADVDKGGTTTLPARTLSEMVRELPDSPVELNVKGTKASIHCDRLDYQLATMPPDDFPEWPEFEAKTTLTLSQSDLREALEKVICAIPARDPRKVLLGVYFDLREDGLRLVSTDGKKLVLVKLSPEEIDGAKEASLIVPSKIVYEIARQMDEAGTVKVQFGDRQVAFETDKVFYASNVIEGEFPRYEMVIPKEFEHTATISRDKLLAGLRQAAIVQDKNEYGVTLIFKKKELMIASRGQELGTFEGHVEAEFDADDYEIIFNYAFLLDLLKACGGQQIALQMNAPSTPAIIQTDEDKESVFLLMPIRATDYDEPDDEDDEDEDDDDDL